MGRIVRSAVVAKGGATLESVAADDAPPQNGEAGQNGQGDTDTKQADGYLDRVAKYVPAEVVAFFIFVNSILDNAVEQPVAQAMASALKDTPKEVPAAVREAIRGVDMAGISIWAISWIMLVVALAMTPVYLKSVADSSDHAEAPGANIVMSMLAFPFWAYAVDAVAFRPWHDGALASIMLATFTLISGAIRPEYINAGLNLLPGVGSKK